MHSKLPNAKAAEFYQFMLNPPTEVYVKWLPEEHYECHLVRHSNDSPIGDLIYFDQNIGGVHRMKFHAVIRIAEKPNHILFQMQKFGVALPGYLELKFQDTFDGLLLTEEIRIGFRGLGKNCFCQAKFLPLILNENRPLYFERGPVFLI
jgi:hypothetical protein